MQTSTKISDEAGILYLRLCRRNTLFTFYNKSKSLVCATSNGCLGFTKATRRTLYASEVHTKHFLQILQRKKVRKLRLHVLGFNKSRKKVLQLLRKEKKTKTFQVSWEKTTCPHNGCRTKKQIRRKRRRRDL